MKLKKDIKVANSSEHKARFRKVAGVGLVAGALIATFGTGQITFAEEIATTGDSTAVVTENTDTATDTSSETTTEVANTPVSDIGTLDETTTAVTDTTTDNVTSNDSAPMLRTAVASTATTEPKAVESSTTASISTTTEVDGVSPSDAGRYSYDVSTTLTGDVKEGDYVEYTFENLPHAGLDGKSVTIADGTVIGTLSKVSDTNARTVEMNGTDSQKQSLEVGSYDSVYRVVFHNTVENLQNISYSFGLINGNNVWTYVEENTPITSSISANGTEVASYTTTIKGAMKETQTKSALYQSSSQATYTTTGVDGTRLNFNVRNANEVPISSGDTLTATLPADAGIVFDVNSVKVGQIVTIQDVGSNNDLATVNDNGVLLFDDSKYRFEVVSVSENEITYKALDSFRAVDGRYGGLYTKFIVTDESVIDLANNQLKIPSYTSTLTGTDGAVKSEVTEAMTIPITGTKIDASAIQVPRADVDVVYVGDSGEILEAQSKVLDDVKVGTEYTTVAKTFDGYKLKETPSNATGTSSIEDTLVTYVYVKNTGSVFEDNFIEGTTTKLTDTVTVVSKASVGSAYDSSAQEEVITLADGKSYKLVSKATNSTGKVAEMDIYLANYYSEIKGSVVVKYVDTAGNTISEDVVDTKDSSTGVSYDTTDNKPTMILVKNADETVTAFAFKEISEETSVETGKVVAGETVVTYVYEEVAIVPVKDVLNKDGESVDGGKATVGDVLTFVLDGSPISDGIQGGLWQYDLKDVLDTDKVEYIDGSVKVYAGEFANITLPDGSVLKADDDISSYVTIEFVDGVLTIKPTEEFYTILQDNGVEDLVDIDAQFDVKVIADGTIENTLIQVVNTFEFKSNTTTTEAEVPVVETPEEPKADEPVTEAETPVVEESKQSEASLPNTGTENSYALSVMGVLALFGSLFGFRKKKELE
ncbi:MucBP domain-containing protein [Streptococcus suis]|uniref:MucBP domain-containing protein n=1 Tax=Streptococcus suis TaxID=1307 RepID=UPI00192D234A|nr:MucBP domain-containing protein [Streptococcus suis]MBL6504355.1 MucBP domain-containing protein [Streptococcus suis]MBM0241971.1 MucBP domain-containing protein [Streptococcus suis]MBM7205092.1 MucBP domain-containing protein [Streptococcus suis]MBM7282467.1 MucBP domain-containing protein [Streptococcus suis]MBO4135984.1 MucBP domain-containing protein [Streptococcus suis]